MFGYRQVAKMICNLFGKYSENTVRKVSALGLL